MSLRNNQTLVATGTQGAKRKLGSQDLMFSALIWVISRKEIDKIYINIESYFKKLAPNHDSYI